MPAGGVVSGFGGWILNWDWFGRWVGRRASKFIIIYFSNFPAGP